MPTNANRPVRRRKVVAHYSDANPSTFTKKGLSKTGNAQDSSTSPPPTTTTDGTAATPSRHPQDPLLSSSSRKRKAAKTPQASSPTPPPAPPPQDDVSMAHPCIIQPVFPLKELIGSSHSGSSTVAMMPSSNSMLLGNHHNGQIPTPPPPPAWRPVRGSHVKEYDPIGTVTWLSIRFDDPSYAVVGDCRGGVGLIQNNDNGTVKVIRTTRAAMRDALREIKRRKVMVYPNAIVQCNWSHGTIVVLTKMEVECLSADSGESLWVMPIEIGDVKKTAQQSPLFSLKRDRLLWTTTGQWGPSTTTTPGSLLLWDDVREKDTKPVMLSLLADSSADATSTTTTTFRCLVALWERTTTTTSWSSFFFVGQQTSTDSETTELIRGHVDEGSSSKTNITVEARQTLPSNGRNILNECTLQLFDGDNDQYLFVVGRGIRMYWAADLTYLAAYGESVQVHGKTVFWSRCCWLPVPDIQDGEIRISRKNCWIERADALAAVDDNNKGDDDVKPSSKSYWLMGMPHPFKGPEELRSNLYVWPQGHDGASTTFFKAPAKGCLSDVWVRNRRTGMSTGWSAMVVSAAKGELQQLCDSVKTNFPGVMYPVGFNITPDNIEYIEDEDELDEVIANFEKPMLGLYDEDPVIATGEEPQVKDPRPQRPLFIDVLAYDDNEREDEHPVICWPEARQFDNDHLDSPGSPKRGDRRFHVLPQLDEVKQVMAEAKDEEETDAKPKSVPKKKRATNLETIKQSSIDPRLRSVMERRRLHWQDSTGSALDPSELKHSLEEKSLAMELLHLVPGQKRRHLEAEESDFLDGGKDELSCSACLGRMTLHSCGKREGPIDYDAIAREEHAQREREEAEKIRIKKERQKLAELKRKENKKMKKLEEERRLKEQQQTESEALINATRKQSNNCSTMDVEHTDYSHHHQSPSFHCRDFFAYPPTLRIDGNEVVPSTSLDPTDALSALAGLADSLSNHATPDLSSTNWNLGHHDLSEGRHGFGEGLHSVDNYFSSAAQVRTLPSPLILPSSDNFPPAMSSLDNGMTNGSGTDFTSSASTAFPCGDSDDVVTNEAESITENDITFYTAPGSVVPIMASPVNSFTAKEESCHDDNAVKQSSPSLQVQASNPMLQSVNGSSPGFLSSTGISAIAMLSETAARQAIVEGTQNGLILPSDHLLVEPRNGSKEMLEVNNAQNQCTESQTNGLRLDYVPTGAQG